MAVGMAMGLVADAITYGQLKIGINAVGMGNAGTSAAQKLGLGLGMAVFGWVLSGAGFDASLDLQGLPQPASVPLPNFMRVSQAPVLAKLRRDIHDVLALPELQDGSVSKHYCLLHIEHNRFENALRAMAAEVSGHYGMKQASP